MKIYSLTTDDNGGHKTLLFTDRNIRDRSLISWLVKHWFPEEDQFQQFERLCFEFDHNGFTDELDHMREAISANCNFVYWDTHELDVTDPNEKPSWRS